MSLSVEPSRRPFLTAEWRHLAMLSFEADPALLRPLVPAGTELDAWQGRTLVSVVGFLFLRTRVLGIGIPFHRDFEEVNLRFYVRRRASDGWRRGVAFIKEMVPRAAVAWTAKAIYGENYTALPMSHRIEFTGEGHRAAGEVSYGWTVNGRENRLEVIVRGPAREIDTGSEEEFITEHHWGYTRRKDGRTLEYQVDHPRWRVWTAERPHLDCDAESLYGSQFAQCLRAPPTSAFLADGSEVSVFGGTLLPSAPGL